MDIPLDKAELIALFVECILYGIFVVTFGVCLYILGRRRNAGRLNMPMVLTAVLLFVCSTMHVSIDLARILYAFHTYQHMAGGPVAYLGNAQNITHVMKSIVYITETCISDALVVYRCHVVVRRHVITILLSFMVMGSAIAGYGSIYMLTHSPRIEGSIFNSSVAPWITSFDVITAATNILATSLIAYSIWRVSRIVYQHSESTASMLSPVILVVVESGAVYAFVLLLLTALYTTDSNAQFIVLDGVSPLIGIVFCGMIIRVGLSPASETPQASWLWTTQGILTDIVQMGTVATGTCPGNAAAVALETADDIEAQERKSPKEITRVFSTSPSHPCSK